jgi:8-oxo-dGTP pyrophosphatase MutT (NUDIX family)
VFLVRRHEQAAFMGGAHVFPGGAVDPEDREVDAGWCAGAESCRGAEEDGADMAAFHVAGLRELFEEAGVLIARGPTGAPILPGDGYDRQRFAEHRRAIHARRETLRAVVRREGLRLALDALTPVAHWVTPPVPDGRRFDTHFFLARLPPGQDAAHDEHETSGSVWLTPSGAIAAAARHEIVLPPPTWTTLREIDAFGSIDDIEAWARQRRIDRREPRLLERDGMRMLVMPGDPRHPDRSHLPATVRETCFVWHGDRWHPEG